MFLNTVQLAAYLNVTPEVLRVWRHRRIGPAYIKAGPHGSHTTVLYREADVIAYLRQHLRLTDRMVKPTDGPIAGRKKKTRKPV